MQYEEIPELTRGEIHAAIERDNPDELLYAVLSAALYDPDPIWAAGICLKLASHPHFNVRGNALLGFGHIARLHGTMDRNLVQPIVEAALRDPHDYVRAQADCTLDDFEVFLKWDIARPKH